MLHSGLPEIDADEVVLSTIIVTVDNKRALHHFLLVCLEANDKGREPTERNILRH